MFCTTASGVIWDLENPRPEDVRIEDIAHALSMQCRFNGHTRHFYSIAEHCLRVADELGERGFDPDVQLLGLLHDASEAYLGDVIRPLKRLIPAYRIIEGTTQAVILTGLGLDHLLNDRAAAAIHEVDVQLCAAEARDLMHESWRQADADNGDDYPAPLARIIDDTMSPGCAMFVFGEAYRQLRSQCE